MTAKKKKGNADKEVGNKDTETYRPRIVIDMSSKEFKEATEDLARRVAERQRAFDALERMR